jgi:hypothetical protein
MDFQPTKIIIYLKNYCLLCGFVTVYALAPSLHAKLGLSLPTFLYHPNSRRSNAHP